MHNLVFELKVKEFEILNKKYRLENDILFLVGEQIQILGCKYCYGVQAEATPEGYKIPYGDLINIKTLYEKYEQIKQIPNELALNCWLCPYCKKLFNQLIPDFDLLGVNNVSI